MSAPAAQPLPVADRADSMRALRALLRPERWRLAAAATLLVAGTASELAGPLLLGQIVNVVAEGRGAGAVTAPALALLATTTLGALLGAAGFALLAEAGERGLARLRERVVAHALALPLERIERAGPGDLHARVSEDVGEIAEAVRVAVPPIAASALVIVLSLAGLATLDLRFALAGLCAVPAEAAGVWWYLRRSTRVYARGRAAAAARSDRLLSVFAGVRTVRALNLREQQLARVRERSLAERELAIAAVRLRTSFFGYLNVGELTGLAAVLVAGFLLVRSGATSIGDATAAALLFVRLFDPIMSLLALVDDAQQGAACFARLVGVTEAQAEREPARPATPRGASLALVGVRHAYAAGHEVLRGIELRVADGERVALVGVSGAGKSTLARIAAGVLAPTAGAVRIGGATLAELGPRRTRATIGLVTQEVHVFAGTLADDLRLVRADASDDRLAQALARVGALAWAKALPQGLATRVGEGGVRLDAVRSQQLALARLVLADPPIALLDEATAEAGSAGARVLERAARSALAGRTALVVAHRLSQAADADRVVVLDAGRVVEEGSHAALAQAGGPYAALWSSWSAAR